MKIVNKQFKVPKIADISTNYILECLEDQNIVRWAIVEVTDEFYVIDCVFEK